MQELYSSESTVVFFDTQSQEYTLVYSTDVNPLENPAVARVLPKGLVVTEQYFDSTINQDVVTLKVDNR